MLTVKPDNSVGTIGGTTSGIHPVFGLQYIRRKHASWNQAIDLVSSLELLPKKKVKPTYRSIDSEWEPTKKYE